MGICQSWQKAIGKGRKCDEPRPELGVSLSNPGRRRVAKDAPFDTPLATQGAALRIVARLAKPKIGTFKKKKDFALYRGLSTKLSKTDSWEMLPSIHFPSIRFAIQETRYSGNCALNIESDSNYKNKNVQKSENNRVPPRPEREAVEGRQLKTQSPRHPFGRRGLFYFYETHFSVITHPTYSCGFVRRW